MADAHRKRILLLGATGTIGGAAAAALARRGHVVVCFIRPPERTIGAADGLPNIVVRSGDPTDPKSLAERGFCGERFDALVSCLASRTGEPRDAWRIDYQAHVDALAAAQEAGVQHVTLLSAICVQKPKLEFQKAKLAFERVLMDSGVAYSIVRPTAFFKSLSGQIERVRAGKPYLLFGDGRLTACKPISDNDLAEYLADCVDDPDLRYRILPIGGPGPAITPIEQGERLFELAGRPPKFVRVPPSMLLWISRLASAIGVILPSMRAKAAYARIGHYYATESMLVLDTQTNEYSDALTPSTGVDTLFAHYERRMREAN